MQTKSFLLAACLFAALFLQASPNRPIPDSPSNSPKTQLSCKIPAPNNFHVVKVGTDMAKVAWDFQPDALGGYRIRTYRTSDHVLVNTQLKGQDQLEAVISGLQSGVAYYCVINSVCSDGSNSNNEANADFIVLILELVVIGFTEGPGESICNLNTQGFCTFSPTGTRFSITGPGNRIKYFELGASSSGSAIFECRVMDNPNTPFVFRCDEGVAPSGMPPRCSVDHYVTIFFSGNAVAQIKISSTVSTPALEFIFINSNFSIDKILPSNIGLPSDPSSSPIHQRGENTEAARNPATTSPNPFSETLEVFPAQTSAENVTLQLFNLSGQKVLAQQFPGGQERYSMSTAGLSPGFYLLRIEADGEVQTLKVVKSE